MNAGKSTILLQSSYNYRERGMNTLILSPEIDTRFGSGKVASRIGLEAESTTFRVNENLWHLVSRLHASSQIHCVLVDEAQFLSRGQVRQLSDVCDRLGKPVLCYGLRTDFQGNLFEGSAELLAWADSIHEIKTICHCGRKATMVLRTDGHGTVIRDGRQVQIGDTDRYLSVCRQHFKEGISRRQHDDLPLLEENPNAEI